MQTNNDENIAKTLRKSLESTRRGLTLFANSIRTSGLEKAVPEYRELQLVLTQQRLWSENKGRKELIPLWKDIAEQSSQIYNVFSSLAEIMNHLSSINSLSPVRQETLRTKILSTLAKPQSVSLFYLTKNLGYERKIIASEAITLKNEGLVEIRGKGNGTSYRLTKKLVGTIST